MLTNVDATKIATPTWLFLMAWNSFIPRVSMENKKNTEALITTAARNPINK